MPDDKDEMGSLLGKGSEFKGKLTFLGTVRIEGRFEGDVLSDDTMVVAEGGEVKGTLDVGALIVTGGLVEGTIRAARSVEIHPPGRVVGDVKTPSLLIEKGAVFQGTSAMPDEPAAGLPAR
ncbi:MAG: polymer-forming cytoskeletal protein [Deltaproteobacteria bacterium]|nr:polymer-forming cytoskeletal protein [Deltaproteobacteria bacterium]